MGGLFTVSASAFSPFFEDPVVLECARASRTQRTTILACVLDSGLMDPLADGGTGNSTRVFAVSIRRCDIETDGIEPQIGDKVKVGDAACRVSKVSVSATGAVYELEVRET